MKPPPCDNCGADAYIGERDLIEVAPVEDKDGILWSNWMPCSKWRFGCRNHWPELGRLIRIGDADYQEMIEKVSE